jgi:hypothetical protein
MSKIIPLDELIKKWFSAMDIETMEYMGEEIPISISIKTKNKLKIFILDLYSDFNKCLKPLFRNELLREPHLL